MTTKPWTEEDIEVLALHLADGVDGHKGYYRSPAAKLLSLLNERGMLKDGQYIVGFKELSRVELIRQNVYPTGKLNLSDFKQCYHDLVSKIQEEERERCAAVARFVSSPAPGRSHRDPAGKIVGEIIARSILETNCLPPEEG